jgi:hypothetical protein
MSVKLIKQFFLIYALSGASLDMATRPAYGP